MAKGAEAFELASVMLKILNQKKPIFIFVKINGHIISTIYSKYYTKGLFTWRWEPQAGEVTGLGGVTRLSI